MCQRTKHSRQIQCIERGFYILQLCNGFEVTDGHKRELLCNKNIKKINYITNLFDKEFQCSYGYKIQGY